MRFLLGLTVGALAAGVVTKVAQDPEIRSMVNDLRDQLTHLAEQVTAQAADAAKAAKDAAA